jgi:hypothetical protein
MAQYLKNIRDHEITINTHQNKTLTDYKLLLGTAFKEMIRVLKPLKFLLVTFHNTDFEIRNSIIEAGLQAGFQLKQLLHQMPARVSVKSMLHHKGSPVGDYYIRFQKPASPSITQQKKSTLLSGETLKAHIQDIIIQILCHRGEPTSFLWISNYLDEYLFQADLYPLPAFDDYMKIIKEQGCFEIDRQGNWWFPKNDLISLSPRIEPALTGRIEQSVHNILNQMAESKPTSKKQHDSKKATLKQYVFNTLYAQYRGVYTPDKLVVSQIIEKELKKKTILQ